MAHILNDVLPGDAVEFSRTDVDGLPDRCAFGFLQSVNLSVDGSSARCVVLSAAGVLLTGLSLESLRPLRRGRELDVTVQVVTFGRPRLLQHTLSLIARQDCSTEKLEVIVIDDSPTCPLQSGALEGLDKTFVEGVVRFIAVEQRVSIGAKRNLAAALSRGKVLMHWDDDDFFGPSRVRLQSSPIVAGETDITLVPLVHSFHAADGCGPDGFYEAAGIGGHLCTLSYRRSLWNGADPWRRYPDASLMEDLFLFRNLTDLNGASSKDLPLGAVDFVYVKHGGSASACPRVGRPAARAPAFLPTATLQVLSQLRDEVPAKGPAQTITGQLHQELLFLEAYLEGSTRVRLPRRFFMDLAKMIPMMPTAVERTQALEALSTRLRRDIARFDSVSLSMAAWCCSTLRLPADNPFWSTVSGLVTGDSLPMNAADVSMLTYVAGRVGLQDDTFLIDKLLESVAGFLESFQPQDIVNIVSACARLGVSDETLLDKLLNRFPQSQFSPQEWIRLTWSFSRLQPALAETHFFPRFTRAPPVVTEKLFSALDALAQSSDIEVHGGGEVPILLWPKFLSRAECAELIRLASGHWGRTENAVRKVDVAVLNRGGTADHPLVLDVRSRVSALVGLPRGHCESLHLVRYEEGEEHKAHYDYTQDIDVKYAMKEPEPKMDSLLMGGQRHCTVLLYLRSLAEGDGGETRFEHLNVRVRPRIGAALLWPNVDRSGEADPRTMHCSEPLRAGEKYVANAWLRSEDIDHLRNVPSRVGRS